MMLSNLTDEEKIAVTARLSKEVLGGATSYQMFGIACKPLPILSPSKEKTNNILQHEAAIRVLSDTFAILTSPNIRVKQTNKNDEDDMDGYATFGPITAKLVAAKGVLLSKISQKHLIEIVIPILCNLKTILEKHGSPLLKDLMRYFQLIFRYNNAEVQTVLMANSNLLIELEYD
eukprot:CAMPEP_0194297364 /NCGR_PEP_ID=MMETSP0169-20130528/58689_1 /TAXON_ID=218684 /ORGANISM="Corethron pennatum, Strain L29A3" /LENGTH=174 /DNA_ID=CAMNT_0039047143 /DNA_START=4022 /DNA_END=4543 /DNA_ORIENTATION=+